MAEAIRDVTVARQHFRLRPSAVKRAMAGVMPDPIRDLYVVVNGRRYPPKQVLGVVTALDRARFTTHQAVRVLRNLGFVAGRREDDAARAPRGPSTPSEPVQPKPRSDTRTRLRPSAAQLEPYVGAWIATRGAEVLVGAPTAQEVVSWLNRHDQRADGMFRVPRTAAEAGGAAPL